MQGCFSGPRPLRAPGASGWPVRSGTCPIGSVEAVFEGPQEPVESMVRWCEHGPAGARVDGVDVTWELPAGDAAFEVR